MHGAGELRLRRPGRHDVRRESASPAPPLRTVFLPSSDQSTANMSRHKCCNARSHFQLKPSKGTCNPLSPKVPFTCFVELESTIVAMSLRIHSTCVDGDATSRSGVFPESASQNFVEIWQRKECLISFRRRELSIAPRCGGTLLAQYGCILPVAVAGV